MVSGDFADVTPATLRFRTRHSYKVRLDRPVHVLTFTSVKIAKKMSNYHKLEAKTVQELRDIANKIRIHSVSSTQAAKSG